MAEMEWFIKASKPFSGLKVSTVSEQLSIHTYESKTLTKAFQEITGIEVRHDLMGEGARKSTKWRSRSSPDGRSTISG